MKYLRRILWRRLKRPEFVLGIVYNGKEIIQGDGIDSSYWDEDKREMLKEAMSRIPST